MIVLLGTVVATLQQSIIVALSDAHKALILNMLLEDTKQKYVTGYRSVSIQSKTVSQVLCALLCLRASIYNLNGSWQSGGYWKRYYIVCVNLSIPLKPNAGLVLRVWGLRESDSQQLAHTIISDPSPPPSSRKMSNLPPCPQKLICACIHEDPTRSWKLASLTWVKDWVLV